MERNDLTFVEHLEELRGRIIKVILVWVITSAVFYGLVDDVIPYLIKPAGRLIFTAPAEAFFTKMMITLLGGFFLSMPYTLYHLWAFVGAGLTVKERKHVVLFGPLSLVFFMTGASFAYFVIIPIAMTFLLGFSTSTILPMITVSQYVSFVGMMIFAFGIIFELPLILIFLTKIGIATPAFLVQKRKYAILIIFIVSAILTPPDCITQILMAVPLIFLYELGIVFSRLAVKQP